MHHHNHSSPGKVIAAFLAGAAVAVAAGGYLLYGPEGRRRRDAVEDWLDEVKDEVQQRLAKVKNATQTSYDALVDEVLESYAAARDLSGWQARRLAARFKARYRKIQDLARDAARRAREETEDLE